MIVIERRKDAKASGIVKTQRLTTRRQNPFAAMLLRLFCCETMVAAWGLMILACLSWREIFSIEGTISPPSRRWLIALAASFLGFAFFGILTTAGSMIGILIASVLEVPGYRNHAVRNLVRFYLLAMFLMILADLMLHAFMGYAIWSNVTS